MKPNLFHRFTALLLIGAMLGSTHPAPLLAQQVANPEPATIATDRPLSLPPAGPQPDARLLREQEGMLAKAIPVSEPVEIGPREPQPQLPVFPKFSDPPADSEIEMVQVFAMPPVPFGVEKPGENTAFVHALEAWNKSGESRGGFAALEEFVAAHPGTRWEVAVRREIARIHLREGYFSRGAAALERAWEVARTAKEGLPGRIADGLAAELAELDAQLGRDAQLSSLITETKDRAMSDESSDRIRHAGMRFGAGAVRGQGGSGNCGASALVHLLGEARPNVPEPPILKDTEKLLSLGLVPGPGVFCRRSDGDLRERDLAPVQGIHLQLFTRRDDILCQRTIPNRRGIRIHTRFQFLQPRHTSADLLRRL